MSKLNKVFTKVLEGEIDSHAGPIESIDNAVLSWLAQEDIAIFAIDGVAVCNTPSENDGFTRLAVELSQAGVYGEDGALMALVASEGWNTTPAGVFGTVGNKFMALPQGRVINVKEEGLLYVNCATYGKTAGVTEYSWRFTVYYTKGA
ncbi:hypothetical protein ES705_50012 [subsurface metagenome]